MYTRAKTKRHDYVPRRPYAIDNLGPYGHNTPYDVVAVDLDDRKKRKRKREEEKEKKTTYFL